MGTSLYYDDFETGQVFRSPGRTITEADLTIFSMVSGDWNPIHSDAEYARASPYGERVVHGALGVAIATGMFGRLGIFEESAIALLGIEAWRFKAPIFVGDTLTMEMEIGEKRLTTKGDRGIIDRIIRLVNQKEEVVQEGRMGLLIRLAPQ